MFYMDTLVEEEGKFHHGGYMSNVFLSATELLLVALLLNLGPKLMIYEGLREVKGIQIVGTWYSCFIFFDAVWNVGIFTRRRL